MKRMWVLLLVGVVLGCGKVTGGGASEPPVPLKGPGLEGCTGQRVVLDRETGGQVVFVVRCPGMDSMSSTRSEGKTTSHGVTLTGAPPPAECPKSPISQVGCAVLPEVLTQGQSVLYTVKCPR